jgi:phosphoglycolate phosphatase-like HAD superfamily hydrolase
LKAIVFDVDGTLIESMSVDSDLYVSSISAILGPVEFRANFGDYDHVTERGIIEQLMVDNDLAVELSTIHRIRERFVASLSSHIDSVGPFPKIHGANQFIDSLRDSKEHRVAIATGGWRGSAILKLETSGINVNGIPVASCDDSHSRTEIMRVALARLGDEFESVTYFGDAEWDRRACKSLGWDFVPVGSDLGGIQSYDGVNL